MQATRFETRFQLALQALILLLGFTTPWLLFDDVLHLETRSSWLVLSYALAHTGFLSFVGASLTLLGLALLLTGLGAWMRLWGAAWRDGLSVALIQGHETLLADGPFRHTRHPLAFGAILHTAGIALLMPPSGAIAAIVLLWLLNVRLALAEEAGLRQQLGPAYDAYAAKVPRFLPIPAEQVAAAGRTPRWGAAVLAESYPLLAFGVLAGLGWDFNATPLKRDLVICLGVAIVARAFAPQPAQPSRTPAA